MIVLSNTTDRLYVVLGGAVTTTQLKCVTSWRDRTATTFTADRTVVSTNNTTDVSMAGSPAASTQRLIDYFVIYNADTVSAIVTIKFDANGTQYTISTTTLLTGERLVFTEQNGISIITASGGKKADQSAAGSNMQIQYNNNGVLGGSSALTYDFSLNDLILGGTDAGITLGGITNEPAAPSAGNLNLYSKNVSGRMLPKWKGPSGLDTPFQPAFFGNNIVLWQPGATSGVMNGSVQTAIAAGVAVLPTTANLYSVLRRSTFTVATGANLQNSLRSESMFFRGASTSMGGFFFFCRFGFETWTTGNRLFIGLTVGTTAVTTGDPSALLNILGFGIDTADTAITFMHNDGSGTATKDAIAGQPAFATRNAYDVYIFCKPNDSTVYYRIDNMLTQTTLVNTSTSTDLPVNTTMMNAHAAIGSGTNAGAAVAVLGLNRIYVETDY